jgi:Fur family zinc uptake transcriptional regulator
VTTALHLAEGICAERGARLTKLRRDVLELVWHSHEPAGAYELMDRLRARGRSAAPPTVYRALEFLLEQGLVHRIASLNAFVGCAHPDGVHVGQFLICARCGTVTETDDPAVALALGECARRSRFRIERPTIELHGTCARCQAAAG